MSAEYAIGSDVACRDGACGELIRVIVDPVARTLTHLVVGPHDAADGTSRLVPMNLVAPEAEAGVITLACDRARFDGLDQARVEEFLAAQEDRFGYGRQDTLWMPYFPLGGMPPGPMPAQGAPAVPIDLAPQVATEDRVPLGEVQIRRGQPVHAVDGDIGKVRGLVVDPADEQVTHVLLEEGHLWGRKTVGIPIGSVESVTHGIRLHLTKDEVRDLPEIELADR